MLKVIDEKNSVRGFLRKFQYFQHWILFHEFMIDAEVNDKTTINRSWGLLYYYII